MSSGSDRTRWRKPASPSRSRASPTNGQVETGLFAIRSTGVSTEPVRKAADGFLAALTPAQRSASTLFAVDDAEWRKWMNQHFYVRQGVSFQEMTPAQRDAGIRAAARALSARGLKQTRDIMRLNHTLGELNDNDFDRYGEWRYHITVMGKPSATEPWGWQLDGHHAIVNYFVLGDQVVMTPFFAGSEPVIADVRQVQGHGVLQDEQNRGAGADQRARPTRSARRRSSRSRKTGNDNLTEALKDNVVLDYAGLRVSELTERAAEAARSTSIALTSATWTTATRA